MMTNAANFRFSKNLKLFFIFTLTLSCLITIVRYSRVMVLNDEVCSSKSNIVFLKTHKTAGSSIQNVFMRYANRHNLLVVLPQKHNYLGHPYKFNDTTAPRLKPGYTYNILTHHSRFNYESTRRLMAPDAVFVTVLRDPVTAFESLYDYYSLNALYKMNLTSLVSMDLSSQEWKNISNVRLVGKIGRNQMAFDLGIDEKDFEDEKEILKAARRLDRQFHLVMIAEFMDQSLVLLKNLLCWSDFSDVAALKHNVRYNKSVKDLGKELKRRILLVNKADQILYDYFYQVFIRRVEEFRAERMQAEVEQLHQASARLYERCIAADNVNSSLLDKNDKFRVFNKKVKGFQVKKAVVGDVLCEDIAKAEIPFTAELLNKQHPFLLSNSTSSNKTL